MGRIEHPSATLFPQISVNGVEIQVGFDSQFLAGTYEVGTTIEAYILNWYSARKKRRSAFMKLEVAIDSITSMWIPLELMHKNIAAQCLLLAKPSLVRRAEIVQDLKTSRPMLVKGGLMRRRIWAGARSNTVVNGSDHGSLAANHPEPSCTNSSFSKETPLISALCIVVSHNQQPYMVFPRNDNEVLFIWTDFRPD